MPSWRQAAAIWLYRSGASQPGWNWASPRSMRSATRETTARRVRARIWAISSKVRPSSSRRRVSFAGEETFSLPSLVARSPSRKRRRTSRISLPYISTFFSPKPDTRRNSCKFDGSTRHKSSSAESCKTTNAETPLSFAVFRRHSRKYSFNSRSTEELATGIEICCCPEGAGFGGRETVLLRLLWATSTSSQSGGAAQASQLPHVSHLGVSPKCRQMWRWRQLSEFTNCSTSPYTSHARVLAYVSPTFPSKYP